VLSKPCAACEHPERAAIDEALARAEPYRELARRFSVSIGQLKRHRKGHMGAEEKETTPDGAADGPENPEREAEPGGPRGLGRKEERR